MKLLPDHPVQLLNASKEERQQFLDSFDLVLTDCDGTVWDLDGPLEGASAGVNLLKEFGKRVVYVTNNSSRSGKEYDNRFKKYNFDATFSDVIHPAIVLVEYLRSIDFKGPIYLISTVATRDLLTEAGFDVIQEDTNAPIEDSFSVLYAYGIKPQEASAVILDLPINVTLKQLIRGQLLLDNPECHFIVGATEDMAPMARPFIGPGLLINVLEKSSQRKPVVLGKPSKLFGDIIIAKYKITDPKRVLFVGDTPEQDIGFGNRFGFQTLAVLFNRKEEDILSNPKPEEIPDFYLPKIADLTKVLDDLENKKE